MKAQVYWLGGLPLLLLLAACGGPASATASSSGVVSGPVTKETLVWSDEFNEAATGPVAPNPQNWTYDTGKGHFGNDELETYCAYGSSTAPCDPKNPNAYVGTDGSLHIVARNPAPGVYTSARIKNLSANSI